VMYTALRVMYVRYVKGLHSLVQKVMSTAQEDTCSSEGDIRRTSEALRMKLMAQRETSEARRAISVAQMVP
jgi:hypothetical protein